MSVINANPLMLGDAGYNIDRSLRFRSSASAYLSRTPASAGNRTTWTFSAWIKRGNFSSSSSIGIIEGNAGTTDLTAFRFAGDVLSVQDYSSSSGYNLSWVTTAVFRDPSAWYHIILVYDTTQVSSANAVKIYVNSVQQTVTFTAVSGSYVQNRNSYINATNAQRIGVYNGLANYFDGYLAEVNFIDGQALTPSSFGQTDAVTGVWTPKKYTGTYGTNGFYLPFTNNSNISALGQDFSGNGNFWTVNNLSLTAGSTYDSMTDVPTLTSATAANYCVLNPLFTNQTGVASGASGTPPTISNANLTATTVAGAVQTSAVGSLGVSSGKWYFEYTPTAVNSTGDIVGFITAFDGTLKVAGYRSSGTIYTNGSTSAGYATWTAGDVIGIALDIGGSTVSCYKNNALQATLSLTNAITDYCYPLIWFRDPSGAGSMNFGQRPFSYTPPTGFKALNTFNLPDPTIKKPNQYMDVITYTGDGTTSRTITSSLGFTPDLAWGKSRSVALSHALVDSVRGNYQTLSSNSTAAESAINSYNLSTANSLITWNANETNQNGATYATWLWKKGATPGFDIVTYTGNGVAGRTVSHSLGVAPAMMIVKPRSIVQDWAVYHKNSNATPQNYTMYLNLTNAAIADSNMWNNTAPSSSVFTVGSSGTTNSNGNSIIAYLFAEIAGFSKFGSYTGNGSTDGPFVYCGFRPKYVLVKRMDSANSWAIVDTARDTYNATDKGLIPNTIDAEGTGYTLDYLSNGFKIRLTGTAYNASGGTYIYAAFAENPFKYSLAR